LQQLTPPKASCRFEGKPLNENMTEKSFIKPLSVFLHASKHNIPRYTIRHNDKMQTFGCFNLSTFTFFLLIIALNQFLEPIPQSIDSISSLVYIGPEKIPMQR